LLLYLIIPVILQAGLLNHIKKSKDCWKTTQDDDVFKTTYASQAPIATKTLTPASPVQEENDVHSPLNNLQCKNCGKLFKKVGSFFLFCALI